MSEDLKQGDVVVEEGTEFGSFEVVWVCGDTGEALAAPIVKQKAKLTKARMIDLDRLRVVRRKQ